MTAAGILANPGAAEVGPSSPRSGTILEVFGKIFRNDARKLLARFLGLSEGAAKKKLEGERSLSLDEFCALLRTPQGFHYLTAVMADSQVKWWRVCRPLMEVAEVTEMQLAARRKLKRAISGAFDADASLTAAIGRAEALLHQDEDHYRGHADALRGMARIPDSAVAAAAGKGRR